MYRTIATASALIAAVRAQGVGTNQVETHPTMSWSTCVKGGACTSKAGEVVLDANWRWTHTTTGYTNCYTGNTWDATLCPDDVTCAKNCVVDGADYEGTYGITSSGDALTLKFVTQGAESTSPNIGSRTYLMASETEYEEFMVLNKEFTFDVDVSKLPCGLNGALYFVSMDADGGMAKYPTNTAGAKYGTGYCDSQCPRDLKYINGQANVQGWEAQASDPNAGTGQYGSCCSEMDVWEANSMGAALTPHPCSTTGQTRCNGDTGCGGTYSDTRYGQYCDPDGCDFNSYRMGNTSFYGMGKTVDTSKPFTVVTQFHTHDGTDTGTLSEIKRYYVQDGITIANSKSDIKGVSGNVITQAFCDAQKKAFGDANEFDKMGGLAQMGAAMAKGMVLVMSIWDDHFAQMEWLDSTYPTTDTSAQPGAVRGACAVGSGTPASVEVLGNDISVTYSNIKFGPIDSTFKTLA